jgi:hypothetical protein
MTVEVHGREGIGLVCEHIAVAVRRTGRLLLE